MPEAMLPAGQVGAYLERGVPSLWPGGSSHGVVRACLLAKMPCRVPGLVSAEAGPGDGTLAFHVRTLYAAGTMI
jgi:hypothetical protein